MSEPIDWNAVRVGETEIVHPRISRRKLIAGTHHGWVWIYDFAGGYDSYHKDALREWTIYDPWQEITEECEFVRIAAEGHYWKLYHNRHLIHNDNPNYKVELPRVWMRKEVTGD